MTGLLKSLFFSFLLIAGTFSKTFFVSVNGNDVNSGLSIKQTFRSINKAVDMAEAGDTVYILPGIYNEAISFDGKNGEPDNPIVLLGFSENEKDFPIIDGGDIKPTDNSSSYWMFITNSNWISINRLKFKNAWAYPILIKNSSYITFNNCRFWGGKRVINAEGDLTNHLLIENCFWDQGGEFLWKVEKDSLGVEAWLSMHHEAMGYYNGSLIDFHGTGGLVVIRNNKIIHAYNALRWRGVKGHDSNVEIYDNEISYIRDNDFEPEYYTYNLHIYHNFSHNIHRTLSVDNVEGGKIFYYGNVITTDNDTWTQKICSSFWKIYGDERNLDYPVYAFNNSFYGTGTAFKVDDGELINIKHFNNAYYFSLADNGWALNKWDSTDEFDFDISNKKWPENILMHKQEVHGLVTDIKYVNPMNRDLHLQNGSPGIDAGKIMSFKEFNWKQDYSGSAPDIGAFENDKLVEGPPFRFLIPPDEELNYKERPRIVRYNVEDNQLILYFSDKIEPNSVNGDEINLFENGEGLKVTSVSVTDENYAVTIKTGKRLIKENLSLSFKKMPLGMNGEKATYWASTIKIAQ